MREINFLVIKEEFMNTKWLQELDVNNWVRAELSKIWFVENEDYGAEGRMSDYMKNALLGASKTKNKTATGVPDFNIEKYDIPVVIEDKLGIKKLIDANKDGVIKTDDKAISSFAVNGAVWYAKNMISNGKYREVIAIGVAGDDISNVEISVHYVYGYGLEPATTCIQSKHATICTTPCYFSEDRGHAPQTLAGSHCLAGKFWTFQIYLPFFLIKKLPRCSFL